MNCPLCTDQSLQPHRRGGIEIDICPQCHGIWLDRGEIDRLGSAPPAEPAVVAPGQSADKPKKQKKKKKKNSLGDRLGDILEDVLDL